MRLARLVAAGLALGALAGFVGALLRPRSVHSYHPTAAEDDDNSSDDGDAEHAAPRGHVGVLQVVAPPSEQPLTVSVPDQSLQQDVAVIAR